MQDGEFVGLISKESIQSLMADLGEESEITLDSDLLSFTVLESTLAQFQKEPKIGVLDQSGEKIKEWDKQTFILQLEKSPKRSSATEPSPLQPIQETNKDSELDLPWFMQKLLENMPNGLYASDKEGKLLFYNEIFENEILTKPFLRNSFVYAEKYLRELIRNILSKALEKNPNLLEEKKFPKLETTIPNEDIMIQIMPIKHGNEFIGHLFEFSKQVPIPKKQTTNVGDFLDLFSTKKGLVEMLEEVELKILESTLQKYKKNISQAAQVLKIPRTTLQSRMKALFGETKPSPKKALPPKKPPKKKSVPTKKNKRKS